MSLSRVRGDTYPIEASIKINGEVVDLTGSTMKLSFRAKDGVDVETIVGVLDVDVIGKVTFTPDATDFDVVGEYIFDIQREYNGIVSTHLVDRLIVTPDVSAP